VQLLKTYPLVIQGENASRRQSSQVQREASPTLSPGIPQELHGTRTKPLLTWPGSWVPWSHLQCRDQIPNWVMDFFKWHFQYEKKARRWSFVHWQGIPGPFWWVIWEPKKTDLFYIVICCQKVFDCFSLNGILWRFILSLTRDGLRNSLLYVWPLSFLQVCKCVTEQKVLCNSWLWPETWLSSI